MSRLWSASELFAAVLVFEHRAQYRNNLARSANRAGNAAAALGGVDYLSCRGVDERVIVALETDPEFP